MLFSSIDCGYLIEIDGFGCIENKPVVAYRNRVSFTLAVKNHTVLEGVSPLKSLRIVLALLS